MPARGKVWGVTDDTNTGPSRIVHERHVPCTLRDGTVLRADVYRPADDGRHPVLLQRNPYSKSYLPGVVRAMDPIQLAHAGYVVVVQDVRGRWASDGTFDAYRHEPDDGEDAVAWAADLPYGDGTVGMWGISYMGGAQWGAASRRPEGLRAIAPTTPGGKAASGHGGAVEWGRLAYWTLAGIGLHAVLRDRAEVGRAEFGELVAAVDDLEEVYRTVPVGSPPAFDLGGGFAPWVHQELSDGPDAAGSATDDLEDVAVPALVIGGWYDSLLGPTLDHHRRVTEGGATELAREQTRLVVGPWAHSSFHHVVGERDFGLAASGLHLDLRTSLTRMHRRWFDRWLRGHENGVADDPKVWLFVMGDDVWRAEDEWPLARTRYTPWYLHSGGAANTRHGDGVLSPEPPDDEPADGFVYDPDDPVPTRGGNLLMPETYTRGPVDRRSVEDREDVLVYTSAPLEREVEVTGPVTVTLHAATSAPDTDWTATLVEVLPDGRAYNLCDGIVRASSVHGRLTPDGPATFGIDLLATSHVFAAGHRIRLEVSSSNFPRFDRNPNTGQPSWEATELRPARQTVFHDRQRPSHVTLPVIPR